MASLHLGRRRRGERAPDAAGRIYEAGKLRSAAVSLPDTPGSIGITCDEGVERLVQGRFERISTFHTY